MISNKHHLPSRMSIYSEKSFGVVLVAYSFANLLTILGLPASFIVGFFIIASFSMILLTSFLNKDFYSTFINAKYSIFSLILLPLFFIALNQNFELEFISFILVLSLSYFAVFSFKNFELLLLFFRFIFYLVFLGILISIAEHFFLDSHYLIKSIDNYPYVSSGSKLDFSGFMYNYNSVSYFIICYLALLSYNQSPKQDYFLPLGILFLMFSKLFILFTLIALLTRILSGQIRAIFITVIIAFYLIFSNIVIVEQGDYLYPSMYFREALFSFVNWDFVISLHGWLKQKGIEALFLGNLNFNEFIELHSYQPHSSIISFGLLGGIFFLMFFISNLIFLIYRVMRPGYLLKSPILFSAFISFCIELINWDFYDSFYFWIVFFICCREESNQIAYKHL